VKRRAQRAFTLLEVLLAIAVASILMTAASYLVVSYATIWAHRTDEDAFEEHADGVTDFLQKALDESCARYQPAWKGVAESSKSKEESSEKEPETKGADSAVWKNEGVSMTKVDPDSSTSVPLVHFRFFAMPPALGAALPPGTPGVVAWLAFDERQGLYLIWRDDWSIQEVALADEKDLLRSSVLSPVATKLEYLYYESDFKEWKTYDAPHEFSGTYRLPAFLRITFTQGDRSVTRLLRIPQRIGKMPLF
jgi:prepilin-type N-terminal cleavage/methylation domain-containing protein